MIRQRDEDGDSANASQAASKRARLRDGSDPARRHPKLWFDDGNVIISADTTDFRVPKSLLVRTSSIFLEMVNKETSRAGRVRGFEGCLVLRPKPSVYPEKDIERLLDYMYNGWTTSVNNSSCNALSWKSVSAVLRASRIFEAETYKKEALRQMGTIYPSKISQTDKLYGDEVDSDDVPVSGVKFVRSRDCTAVANFAAELGLDHLHANALYDCVQLSTKELLHGVTHDGGRDKLGDDDATRCVVARRRLAERNAQLLRTALEGPKCVSGSGQSAAEARRVCLEARRACLAKVQEEEGVAGYNPLAPMPWDKTFGKTAICEGCREKVIRKFDTGRQEILDDLGSFFTLDDI